MELELPLWFPECSQQCPPGSEHNMDIKTHNASAADRRRFLSLCAGAIAVAFATKNADADELPHLSATDPTANALGYVEDAANVDAAKYPQHKPVQSCANCQQFTGQAVSGYGPCVIFAGKAVNERGWCAAYVPKA
jgi:High potential iron-sulfur protein